jgi:hypothetical protein
MNITIIALWAFSGWYGGECGTLYPGWWHGPKPPDPEPWWFVSRVMGVVFGLAGGFVYTQAFGPSPEPWASALGGFVLAAVAVDVYARFTRGRQA